MKRVLFDLSIFVIAFLTGSFAASAIQNRFKHSREYPAAYVISDRIRFSPECDVFGRVEIHAESISPEGEFIRIRITNNSCVPAYYRSEVPDSLMASYMKNGKKIPIGYCGTGVKRHILQPGATLKFDQTKSSFTRLSDRRAARFRYGGWFELEGRENQEFWSNEFELGEMGH